MALSGIQIHALSPDREGDYFRFFEGEAFSDNPHWASCYCQCFYEDHRVIRWHDLSAADNRASAVRRMQSQQMQGYLAYLGDEVVGWCNAAPRPLLHALDEEPVADAAQRGTISCFVVIPRLRGQGVATALLAAACEGLREQGMTLVEANPRTESQSAAENHYGPLRMYLAAGFTVTRDDEDGSVWVSKPL